MKVEFDTVFNEGEFVMPYSAEIKHWYDEHGEAQFGKAPLEKGKRYQIVEHHLQCIDRNKVVEFITIPYLVRKRWVLSRIFGLPILSLLSFFFLFFSFRNIGMFLNSGPSGVKNYFGEPEYYGPKRHNFFLFEILVEKEVIFGRFYAIDFTLAPDSDELQKKGRNILVVTGKGKTTMYYS